MFTADCGSSTQVHKVDTTTTKWIHEDHRAARLHQGTHYKATSSKTVMAHHQGHSRFPWDQIQRQLLGIDCRYNLVTR